MPQRAFGGSAGGQRAQQVCKDPPQKTATSKLARVPVEKIPWRYFNCNCFGLSSLAIQLDRLETPYVSDRSADMKDNTIDR